MYLSILFATVNFEQSTAIYRLHKDGEHTNAQVQLIQTVTPTGRNKFT